MIQPGDLQNRAEGGARPRGRPPAAVPSERVQVTLSPATFDAFDRVARERGEPLARVIRQALERRISRHK